MVLFPLRLIDIGLKIFNFFWPKVAQVLNFLQKNNSGQAQNITR